MSRSVGPLAAVNTTPVLPFPLSAPWPLRSSLTSTITLPRRDRRCCHMPSLGKWFGRKDSQDPGGPASSTFSIFDLRRLASSSSGSVTSAATSTNSSPTATCDFPGGLSTYIEGLRGSPRGDKSPSTPPDVGEYRRSSRRPCAECARVGPSRRLLTGSVRAAALARIGSGAHAPYSRSMRC